MTVSRPYLERDEGEQGALQLVLQHRELELLPACAPPPSRERHLVVLTLMVDFLGDDPCPARQLTDKVWPQLTASLATRLVEGQSDVPHVVLERHIGISHLSPPSSSEGWSSGTARLKQ